MCLVNFDTLTFVLYYILWTVDNNILSTYLQDIVISAIFVISLLSGGAASAAYAADNDDFYDNYERLCESQSADRYSVIEDACGDITRVRDSEGAAAVSYNPYE